MARYPTITIRRSIDGNLKDKSMFSIRAVHANVFMNMPLIHSSYITHAEPHFIW